MRRIGSFVILAALAVAPRAADAQTAAVTSIAPNPKLQFFDATGARPLAGGCVQTFQAGSTTPLATYTDVSGGTANPNPLILDAAGRADVWLSAGTAYKFTVRAATPGCAGGGGSLLYTADYILDQGLSLAHALQAGSLTIGLRSSPATGAGGGVGAGNAVLSATTGGLYVSLDGAAPQLLTGGSGGGGGGAGNPAAPTFSVQYNKSGSFGGSGNFIWNDSTNTLGICEGAGTGCTNQSGIAAPAFSSTATGNNPAFATGPGTFVIFGSGDATFQNLTANKAITGASAAVSLLASPLTGVAGGTGTGNALLSATTDGLYLSLNGAPPALVTGSGGAGNPGAPVNSVQYNNAGTFAGSANFLWNPGTNTLGICGPPATGCTNQSGIDAPVFSSTVTGNNPAFTTGPGTFIIYGSGDATFQNLTADLTITSAVTGSTPAIRQTNGTFSVTGAGAAAFSSTAMSLLSAPLTGLAGGLGVGNAQLSATTGGLYLSLNGAPPVLLTGGGGGSGTPGGPSASIQYNNAGSFAGSANLIWNNSLDTLGVTGSTTSGFNGPVFSSSNSGANPAFTTGPGTFIIYGSGDATFQNLNLNRTFTSYVTGPTPAIQQSGGAFKVTGAGDAAFLSTAITLQSAPVTGAGGGTGTGNAQLSATTAGLWLSVNGGAPALLAAGGAPGAPNASVQFNNGGTFAGSPNLIWNNSLNTLGVTGSTTSGFNGPVFSASNTGTNPDFTNGPGTFQIFGNGSATFQSISLIGGITVGNGFYGITAGGALTVSSCSGCSAGVTSWNTRTGAVSLQKQDVTNVEGQGLGPGDTVSFNSISANQYSGGTASFSGTASASSLTANSGGASIHNPSYSVSIYAYDSGGTCGIGTGYAGGIGCSSDARLKKNIRALPDSLAGVLKLRPVTFDWAKNNEPGLGFISQEVQQVFPALVTRGTDGYLVLSEIGLIPELVKAVQQLAARVAALEARR